MLGITRENLTGSRVIRAFNKEDDEKVHFNENNDLLTRAQIYVGKISALMNPLTYVIINGAIVVLVWTGAVRVDNGYITQGEVVALINYMSQILVELVKLANLIININKSLHVETVSSPFLRCSHPSRTDQARKWIRCGRIPLTDQKKQSMPWNFHM